MLCYIMLRYVADPQNHGCDEMYMSYLRSVYKLCCQSGRNLQFWVNPLHKYPEQLWNLPPDVVAVEYGDQVCVVTVSATNHRQGN